jgi:predicted ribonuclease YlaK
LGVSEKGIVTVTLDSREVNKVFQFDAIDEILDYRAIFVKENQYIRFLDDLGNPIMLKRYYNGSFKDLPCKEVVVGKAKTKPLNDEQRCYFDLLHNSDVPIKVAFGIAGTGKTNLAMKFGFAKMADRSSPIEKMILVRNPVECGEAVGFMKGDKNEKLGHWNNPAKDNYEDPNITFESLVEKGKIEMDIPSMMLGRNLKNSWIIVDESQHLSPQMFKMLGERVASGSEIVFIGDPSQDYGYTKKESGFDKSRKLLGNKLFGMVELTEDVRGEVSKLFATQY